MSKGCWFLFRVAGYGVRVAVEECALCVVVCGVRGDAQINPKFPAVVICLPSSDFCHLSSALCHLKPET